MMDEADRKTYFSLTMRRDGKSVNVDFEGEDITVGQVLEEVLHFMKGCGYCFEIDDYLDIVNDFKEPPYREKEDSGLFGVGTPGFNGTMNLDFSDPELNYPDPELTNFNSGFYLKPEG